LPIFLSFFFQAEDGIRDRNVTGVQTCALPISLVIGGIERITSRGPEAPTAAPSTEEATPSAAPTTSSPERRPGTVTDSAGREVEDGTGGCDDPATIGWQTVRWTSWSGGDTV